MRNNVSPLLVGPTKIEPSGEERSWMSPADFAVVLVKAGREYRLYINVTTGTVLTAPKGISHVSGFVCIDD